MRLPDATLMFWFEFGFGVVVVVDALVDCGAETLKEPQYGVGGQGVDGESKTYGEMDNMLSASDTDSARESFFDFIDIELVLMYIPSLLLSD